MFAFVWLRCEKDPWEMWGEKKTDMFFMRVFLETSYHSPQPQLKLRKRCFKLYSTFHENLSPSLTGVIWGTWWRVPDFWADVFTDIWEAILGSVSTTSKVEWWKGKTSWDDSIQEGFLPRMMGTLQISVGVDFQVQKLYFLSCQPDGRWHFQLHETAIKNSL